jgi:hypothetical protein
MYSLKLTEGLLGVIQRDYPDGKPDMPDVLVEMVASVLFTYTAEEEPNDVELQDLITFAESLCILIEQVKERFATDPAGYHEWKTSLLPALNEHAKHYQEFYTNIAHLRTEYFKVNAWMMAAIVDLSINHSVEGKVVTDKDKERINHRIRFGENVVSEIFVAIKSKNSQ